MFTPSNILIRYLNAEPKDIYDIVGALMGYINADPFFKTNDFDEAIKYVLLNGITKEQLFDSFNSELDFEENSEKWNEEYYSYARVYLKENFCEKRINHIKAVAQKLKAIKEKNIQNVDLKKNIQKEMQQKANSFTGEQQKNEKKEKNQHHINANTVTTQKMAITKISMVVLSVVLLVVLFVSIIK